MIFNIQEGVISIDFKSGKVLSATYKGVEICAKESALFSVRLTDKEGKIADYSVFDAKKASVTEEGKYVWVKMGRHGLEQIVYVDRVRYFNEEDAPYDPERVKRVLRKATEEELRSALRKENDGDGRSL